MSNRAPLFRPESLEARRSSWLGRPTVAHSLPTTLLACFSVIFVVAVALFLTFGEYSRRVRVAGVVLPVDGLTRMVSPHAGWVSEIRVREGDDVQRGDVLYVVSIDSTTALGATQKAVTEILRGKRDELRAALTRQAAIDAAEKRSLVDRIADTEREIAQAGEQVALLEESTRQMKTFTDQQKSYLQRGISVSRDYEARLQAYHAERSQLARLRRERIQLSAQLTELRNELAGFDLQAEARIAEIKRQLLDVEQQISEGEARRELQVTAPRDGMVTGIVTLAGQTVELGTPLLTIVPRDRPLVAQLLAPSDAIGFVREGARVLLRYEAFPYQKFGQYPAQVSVISRANLRPEEIAQLGPSGVDPQAAPSLYRITVEPDRPHVLAYGKTEPLQAGMQVEAHVLVDTRPLYQWILEPIYGLRGALAGPAAAATGDER